MPIDVRENLTNGEGGYPNTFRLFKQGQDAAKGAARPHLTHPAPHRLLSKLAVGVRR
jgi:hypothetical protein